MHVADCHSCAPVLAKGSTRVARETRGVRAIGESCRWLPRPARRLWIAGEFNCSQGAPRGNAPHGGNSVTGRVRLPLKFFRQENFDLPTGSLTSRRLAKAELEASVKTASRGASRVSCGGLGFSSFANPARLSLVDPPPGR